MLNQKPLNPPTLDEIAELEELIKEAKSLARQLNYPLLIVCVQLIISLLRRLFLQKLLDFILANMPKNLTAQLVIVSVILPIIIYAYYQVYQVISSAMLAILPNGLGQSLTHHPVFIEHRQIKDRDQVKQMIHELTTLVVNQREMLRAYRFFGLLIAVGLPLMLGATFRVSSHSREFGYQSPSNFPLIGTEFGPAIIVNPATIPAIFDPLIGLCCRYQGLQFSSFIYQGWTNLNKAKWIAEFIRGLEEISSLKTPGNWRILKKSNEDNDYTLIRFSLPNSNTINFKFGNKSLAVSKSVFMAELQRLLFDARLPVLQIDDNYIVMGLYAIRKHQIRRLQQQFLARLEDVVSKEKQARLLLDNLKVLARPLQANNKWQIYSAYDETSAYNIHIYFDLNSVNKSLQDSFLSALKQCIPQDKLQFDNDIIMISPFECQADEFVKQSDNIRRDMGKNEKNQVESEESSSPVARTAQSASRGSKQEKSRLSRSTNLSVYPKKVDFGRRVRFFYPIPIPQPDNFAYPLHIPWLPTGRAYGSVDPRVFNRVKDYLDKNAVLHPLTVGIISGSEDEPVGAGIVRTNYPYQDLDGNEHKGSTLKLKYTNNIRIFGYRDPKDVIVDGERRIHYRFNGPGYGH